MFEKQALMSRFHVIGRCDSNIVWGRCGRLSAFLARVDAGVTVVPSISRVNGATGNHLITLMMPTRTRQWLVTGDNPW